MDRRWWVGVIALGLLAGWPRDLARALDMDGDGVSDVWALHFGVTNLGPSADPDGDAQDNRFESIAGTDPLDPLSRFGARATTDQTNLGVEWFGVAGKRYEVWFSYDLLEWELFDGPLDGAGMSLSVTDGLPSAGGGEMMMSAPDPVGEALAALADDGLVPTWGPYPAWAPKQPPKPPLQLYFVSACALDNGLSSLYFWETTEEGVAHYMVLSNIPLGRLPSLQQWFDRDAGYGAIFLDHPYRWDMFAWYWYIESAEKLEKGLIECKEFTWTSAPFERFGYRAPSGWVLDYIGWIHRFFAENADRFAEEMIAFERATAGEDATFRMAMVAPEEGGGGATMAMSMEPDGIRKFYRVQVIASPDADGDMLDASEEALLGTSDGSRDSDADGMPDPYEFVFGLDPMAGDSGGDRDGDAAANDEDARPDDPGVGRLAVTITSPAGGATVP